MTSAIERLRALLAERGVEWRGGLPTETMVEADGLDLLYVALPDGRVRAFIRNYLTPEQAIEATLAYIEAEREVDRLQTENAKLRELVRLMVRRHTPISPCKNIPCGECPVKDECDQEDALMRELGVEVDE